MSHPDYKADRAAAIAWAASVVADPTTVYLDTETTGLGTRDEIIELAIIDRYGAPLFNRRFKPEAPIEPKASAVHGLKAADLAGAPRFADEWPRILAALAGRRVIIYNAEFDQRLIIQTLARYHLPGVCDALALSECAMEMYAQWAGDWSDYHGNYRWHRLEDATWVFGQGSPADHTALGDARACLGLVARLAKETL